MTSFDTGHRIGRTRPHDMYIAELQELVSVEAHLSGTLLRMAELASHPALKEALLHHREDTEVQRTRLESILQPHDQHLRPEVELVGMPAGPARVSGSSNNRVAHLS